MIWIAGARRSFEFKYHFNIEFLGRNKVEVAAEV
jgi:hypothetical protein